MGVVKFRQRVWFVRQTPPNQGTQVRKPAYARARTSSPPPRALLSAKSASRTNAGTPAYTTLHRAHAGFAMPVSTKSRAAALVLSPGAKGICPVPVRAAAASSSQLGFARLSQRLSASRPTSVTSPLGAIQSRARSSPTKPTG
jgi:hypothetical protein